MQLTITGHHIDVTDSMEQYVKEKTAKLKRHFDQVLTIQVILEVQKLTHKAEATLHISGNHLFADATSNDMYSSIDLLVEKLDRQIMKQKAKKKGHNRQQATELKLAVA
ncbi:MAG TPA: ribosome-associated translation inhibitor RaiA [Thiothrix sp.]|nr:ribosome-associated translation inhibitor RaiA [Thiothrix sp.]